MDDKKKLVISSIVVCFCIIACIIFYGASVKNLQATVNQQVNQIADLQNNIDVKSNQQKSATIKLEQDATGLQFDRVTADDKMMKEFLKHCLTWDNGKDYDKMRTELFQKYNIDENSSFAQVFLPENVKTEDGQYNYIDEHHANSKFEEMHSYVSCIAADRYSYFTYVTWLASDLNGNESTSTCAFTYDITANGTLENLNAYTISD